MRPLDEEILSILEGHEDEAVASVIPWVLLGALQAADPEKLSPGDQEKLAEMFSALGLTRETDAEALNELLARWPRPDPGLVKEIAGLATGQFFGRSHTQLMQVGQLPRCGRLFTPKVVNVVIRRS